MLDKPGIPESIVRLGWECLAKAPVHKVFNSHLQQNFKSIPRETGESESKWTMFSSSIAEAAARIFRCKEATPVPDGGNLR